MKIIIQRHSVQKQKSNEKKRISLTCYSVPRSIEIPSVPQQNTKTKKTRLLLALPASQVHKSCNTQSPTKKSNEKKRNSLTFSILPRTT
jgi:hypothetical protein